MPTTRKKIAEKILSHQLVAIVRANDSSTVQASIDCLVAGGVQVLELTSNTPDYCLHIQVALQKHPELLVGAGTILNAQLAKKAIAAGAQFLVTPNVNFQVIELAHESNIPVLMGASTPTEIASAVAYGADIIKLFPANALGLEYFKAIKAPFNDTLIFAVGGIKLENANAWLSAGADGIGVGNELVKVLNDENEVQVHTAFVKQFMSSIKQ